MKPSNVQTPFPMALALILGACSCLLALVATAFHQAWLPVNTSTAALSIYALMCPITALAYAQDKRRAMTAGRRISERTLHVLELLGGWPAAVAAQHLFRHKNRKWGYQLTFWGIVGIHVIFWLRKFWVPRLLGSG